MKGDFSRWGLDSADNFTAVLHQQGRVLLDADWNASAQIAAAWRAALGRDAIGTAVAAVPAAAADAFRVVAARTDGTTVEVDLEPGRVWVEGAALELVGGAPVTMAATYYPPPLQPAGAAPASLAAGVRDAVVLDSWEDAVSAFQAPELLEPALGGPDTTERARRVFALRLLRLGPDDDCESAAAALADDPSTRGRLTVTPAQAVTITGDCPVEAGGGYTGLEHYLYRIEIAAPRGGQARFKWSRFNGGLVGRGTFTSTGASTGTVQVTANDQMIDHCGLSSFHLDVVTFDAARGHYTVVLSADAVLAQAGVLSLADIQGAWPAAPGPGATNESFFRLWDSVREVVDFPVGANPNELENGIELAFAAPLADLSNYQEGDYWTFPVRAAGAQFRTPPWPTDAPPHGIRRQRAPLGVITWNAGGTASYDAGEIEDCRQIFRPLSNQKICCTFIVGDGVGSHGDFDSIEEAIRHLPPMGGEICLLPGLHRANAVIDQRRDVRITGCDRKTLVLPRDGAAPIFLVRDSDGVVIEHMDLAALNGIAIAVAGARAGQVRDLEIAHTRIVAGVHAVRVTNGQRITIHHNQIRMLDREGGDVAIFLAADDGLIERNDIAVIAARQVPPFDRPEDDGDPIDPVDPCAPFIEIYKRRLRVGPYIKRLLSLKLLSVLSAPHRAQGGIQLAGGCERVTVRDNRIHGGAGNGITLGSALAEPQPAPDVPTHEAHRVEPSARILEALVVPPAGVALAGIQFTFVRSSDPQESHSATTDAQGALRLVIPQDTYRVDVVSAGLEIEHIEKRTFTDPTVLVAVITRTVHVITLRRAVDALPAEPEPFAFLYEIAIEGNEITLMGRSGIGLPALEAPPIVGVRLKARAGALLRYRGLLGNPVVGLSIRRNHIHRCLQSSSELLRDESQRRGLGGISLGFCQQLAIGENRIEENGLSHAQPVCGVFVSYGEEVEIADNHITDNGPLAPGAEMLPGKRGGIVLGLVSAAALLDRQANDGRGRAAARPAARIHANLVDQPAGQALSATAAGPLMVTDNTFSSELSGLSDAEQSVATVWLLNVGGAVPPPTLIAVTAAALNDATLRVVARGPTLFADNQSRTGSANRSAASQAIWARDDLAYEGNQSTNLRGGNLFANVLLEAATVRATGSRFIEASAESLVSLYTRGTRLNVTALNQGDHCILASCPARPPERIGNQELDTSRCDRLRPRA